jgi:hypothetical protein
MAVVQRTVCRQYKENAFIKQKQASRNGGQGPMVGIGC